MPLMLTCLGGDTGPGAVDRQGRLDNPLDNSTTGTVDRQGRLGNPLNISTADSAVTGLVAEQVGRSGRRHGEADLQQLAKLRPRRG